MLPDRPHRPDDLSRDPDDDELSIDLMNDSFFLDGMARIMAEARARGASGSNAGRAVVAADRRANPDLCYDG